MKKEARKISLNSQINQTNHVPKHSHIGLIFTIIVLTLALMVCLTILLSKSQATNANTALVHINGVILSGSGPGYNDGNTYSDDISGLLEQISKNKKIKAVIFEINSPGGSAVGSSEIAYEIYKLRVLGITSVALIREQGTSGAYWVASACDMVYSHPLSITGSIGVLASYLEYSSLLERFNITYERLNAGQYKDTLSPYRELTNEERQILQSKINLIQKAFVNQVARNRNMTEEEVQKLATGMFYLGSEAKDLGLIDDLGLKEDVIEYIEQKENIKVKIKDYSPINSLLSGLYGLQDKAFFMMGKGLGLSLIESQNSFKITA